MISIMTPILSQFFFLIIRRPPRSTRTDTLLSYTTLFRSREDLEIVASHCRTLDAQVLVVPTDVGDAEAVRALAEVARDFTGKVDLWFSNVGVGAVGKFLDVPIETHEQIVRSNLIGHRSEEHTSELQSLMRITYAVFCWKKK